MASMKSTLSTLWIFAILNYLYCDVVTLMDPAKLNNFLAGRVGGMEINQGFLLMASILVEIPIAMVLASRLLDRRANRWTNILAGAVMTAVQLATLGVGKPEAYYLFFSVIEIGCTAAIVFLAWRWTGEPAERAAPAEARVPQAYARDTTGAVANGPTSAAVKG